MHKEERCVCSAGVKRFYVRWSHKQCKPRSRNLLERPSVNSEDLKPNKILIGPLFSEPVQVIVTTPMGPAVTTPSPNVLQAPAVLDCQPIVKVEHYRLKQDSIKHPVELKEEAPPFRTGCNP